MTSILQKLERCIDVWTEVGELTLKDARAQMELPLTTGSVETEATVEPTAAQEKKTRKPRSPKTDAPVAPSSAPAENTEEKKTEEKKTEEKGAAMTPEIKTALFTIVKQYLVRFQKIAEAKAEVLNYLKEKYNAASLESLTQEQALALTAILETKIKVGRSLSDG